ISYDPNSLAQQNLTMKLIQVGKLTKIENVHLTTFTAAPLTPTGSTFDYRPAVTYRIGDTSPSASSTTPFNYPVGNPAPPAQYTFVKAVQFSPRGEARIDNSTLNNGTAEYPLQVAAEIGLTQTHGNNGNVAPTPTPINGNYIGNMVAIQFGGLGADVIIYRK